MKPSGEKKSVQGELRTIDKKIGKLAKQIGTLNKQLGGAEASSLKKLQASRKPILASLQGTGQSVPGRPS